MRSSGPIDHGAPGPQNRLACGTHEWRTSGKATEARLPHHQARMATRRTRCVVRAVGAASAISTTTVGFARRDQVGRRYIRTCTSRLHLSVREEGPWSWQIIDNPRHDLWVVISMEQKFVLACVLADNTSGSPLQRRSRRGWLASLSVLTLLCTYLVRVLSSRALAVTTCQRFAES